MKIRIKGNSIRYRLIKPEVERFSEDGLVRESTDFNGRELNYVLQRCDDGEMYAEFIDDTITLFMPVWIAHEWTNTDVVGFENQVGALSLCVEKDFKCLDNVAEDQSENYPNPLAVHRHEQE